MSQLFDVSTDNVGLHLKNVFEDGELSRKATTEESSVVQIEGGREVQRPVTLFNLDAILAVGYLPTDPPQCNPSRPGMGTAFLQRPSVRSPPGIETTRSRD